MFIQKLITIENKSMQAEQTVLNLEDEYISIPSTIETKEKLNPLKKKLSALTRLNKDSITLLDNMQKDILALPGSYELFARLLAVKQQLTQLNDQIKTLSHSIEEKLKQTSPQPKKKYQSFFFAVSGPTFASPEKYIPKLSAIAENS